ncbi:unnamed protein product [Ectocarpus sp. CCAP 1310/34]|nr:unnamed protein product [Ectocarpus sp. CCAP 1310/34]
MGQPCGFWDTQYLRGGLQRIAFASLVGLTSVLAKVKR